jgi:diacylglycerol O-acyltransferase / trehalose O-mycolyltransferase
LLKAADRRGFVAAAVVLTFVSIATSSAPGYADPLVTSGQIPAATAPDGSKLEAVTPVDARTVDLTIYAASMSRSVNVRVQRPPDTSQPRPTLYLLDGLARGQLTDAMTFMADKNVNVVSPTGGENAYWTDWRSADPALGVNKWETFMLKELPPIVDSALGANGINAIGGMSRTGTAGLQYAIKAPGLFKAVASYSGCAQIGDPVGHLLIEQTMANVGGGNPDNMYGPFGDPMWAANDPYVNAAGLRGTDLYISNGSGIPGIWERLDAPELEGRPDNLARQIYAGAPIEAITNYCTHQLADKLNSLGIPATYNFRATGTHSWGYWQDDFKDSWPVLARGLGVS